MNIGAQRLTLLVLHGPLSLYVAILLGTAAGLVAKYVLDKRWIFADTSTGVKAHGKKFSLYTAMGLITASEPPAMMASA